MTRLEQPSIREKIQTTLMGGDILLVVPPFGSIEDVALAPHILQGLAIEQGFKVEIVYLNILLASVLGIENYEEIQYAPIFWMLGERLFARSAYALPPLGKEPHTCVDETKSIGITKANIQFFHHVEYNFNLEKYLQMEQFCFSFMDEVVSVLSAFSYKIVGCTAMMGQTNFSVALLAGLKKRRPDIITIIGGGNCEGEMAEGIVSLSPAIDYVFSGESDTSFLGFLQGYLSHQLPRQRIIKGQPIQNMDDLPLPDYFSFLNQYVSFLGKSADEKVRIWYETSRGCWWAQKSRCTFCGIYPVSFREKSVTKVVQDLKQIKAHHQDRVVFMTDNMMPHSYHKELLGIMSDHAEFPVLAYQIKANLTLQDLVNLKNANIKSILPGIESFSTPLLNLMNKGITARQNLLLLRNALSVGIYCEWFMPWGFPGDRVADYEEVLRILPLIRHLQPPKKFTPMTIIRFSTYFDHRDQYNITDVRPWAVFKMIFPEEAETDKLAAYHIADYPCESYQHPEIIKAIADEIHLWTKTWKESSLIMKTFMDSYVVYDKRDIHGDIHEKAKTHVLDFLQAREIMTASPFLPTEVLQWAVDNKLGIVVDSWYVPLVTAAPELLFTFAQATA